MEKYKIKNLSFRYPEHKKYALKDVCLSVEEGDFLVICGSSGCGKSTLLRHLKTVLTPHGECSGEIFFDGNELKSIDKRKQTSQIGFVMQSPENQIVTDKVWHELVFGLESLGADTSTIRCRAAETASFFGIQKWYHKNTSELSGGQKQILNLASIMMMQPSVLILDEPTSQLDPIAASEFLSMLGKINRELGVTIIIAEHKLEEALPFANKASFMDNGKLLFTDTPKKLGCKLKTLNHSMFLAMPAAMRIWAGIKNNYEECPLTVCEGTKFLKSYAQNNKILHINSEHEDITYNDILLEANDIWFRYEKDGEDIVKGLNIKLHSGEFISLLGGNGTGKSTSLKLLAGLEKAYHGKIKCKSKICMLPQNPQTLFVKKTVSEDLADVFSGEKILKEDLLKKIISISELCHIDNLLDYHPYDLSGGEQQRVALAKILLCEPDILLLDEPTKGMDAYFKEEFADIISKLLNDGKAVLMVSHDIEFCAEYTHRCAMFFDGMITSEDKSEKFFSGNSFYTTSANRIARHIIPEAITVNDVIASCQGTVINKKMIKKETVNKALKSTDLNTNKFEKIPVLKKNRYKLSKSNILTILMICIAVPSTLLLSLYYFKSTKYNVTALLILAECMLPFFIAFEKRHPKAKELAVTASLCAIGVASRMIFFMFPQFKPVMALTIITGISLGAETGFIVGATTTFVSNMIFSQGSWTPWQMFAMGISGFLAGILFYKGHFKYNRISLSIFGALTTILIFGGITNLSSALIWNTEQLNKNILLTYYISGFPMDCIHAVSTVIFLFIAAEPMIEKLNRIKVKYGILE